MTLNQQIALFKAIGDAHFFIKTTEFGEVPDKVEANTEESIYPVFYQVPQSTTTRDNVLERAYQLLVLDLVYPDHSNLNEVLSDTEQTLNDIIKILRQESNDYTLIVDPVLTPLKDVFGDAVAGWMVEVTVQSENNNAYCDIPSFSFGYPGQSGTGGFPLPAFGCDDLYTCPVIEDFETRIEALEAGTGGNFIPLSGTVNPITGTLEFDPSVYGIIKMSDGSGGLSQIGMNGNSLNLSVNSVSAGSSYLTLSDGSFDMAVSFGSSYIELFTDLINNNLTLDGSTGFHFDGASDFSSNYNNLSFVQKIYVDTAIATIVPTTETLAQTLALGNTTGANDISIDTLQSIKSGNGGGQINLDDGTVNNAVSVTNDNNAYGKSYLYFQDNLYGFDNYAGLISTDLSNDSVMAYLQFGIVSSDLNVYKTALQLQSTQTELYFKNQLIHLDDNNLKLRYSNGIINSHTYYGTTSIDSYIENPANSSSSDITIRADGSGSMAFSDGSNSIDVQFDPTNSQYVWTGQMTAPLYYVPTSNNDYVQKQYVTNAIAAIPGYTLTSSAIVTALGYTPYSSANPSGYITSSSLAPYLLSSTAAITYQPLDADLTAIAALTGTGGLLRTDGSGGWSVDGSNYITRTNISATAPLSYNSTTGVFSIAAATSTTNGYLTATNWNTFNAKQNALNGTGFVKSTAGTISYDTNTYLTTTSAASTYEVLANKATSFATLNNTLYPTTQAVSNYITSLNYITLTSLSATAPLAYNNTTGVFSITQANTSTNGYLSSTDWNTFNGKQAALSGTGFVKSIAGTISYDTNTYLTTSSATSTYVPYTGATTSVDLGIQTLTTTGIVTVGSTSASSYVRVLGDATGTNFDVFIGAKRYPRFTLTDTVSGGSSFSFWNLGGQFRMGTNSGNFNTSSFIVYSGDAADTLFNGNLQIGPYAAGVLTNPRNFNMTGGRPNSNITPGTFTVQGFGAYVTSTNVNGGNLLLASGLSTGNGTSSILFQTTGGGASGTVDSNPTTKMTVSNSGLTMTEGYNIILGTTTGTTLATTSSQKLSLWAATPNVQPTTAITAATFVTNTSGIVNDTATWGGYTMGQIVAALKRIGALA